MKVCEGDGSNSYGRRGRHLGSGGWFLAFSTRSFDGCRSLLGVGGFLVRFARLDHVEAMMKCLQKFLWDKITTDVTR